MCEPRRHHFVPAFYLRRFCAEDGRLHAFDKPSGRTFRASVESIANSIGFYDLSPAAMGALGLERTAMEAALAEHEARVSAHLRGLLEACAAGEPAPLDAETRGALAAFLATQIVRTPTTRMGPGQLMEALRQVAAQRFPDDPPAVPELNEEQLAAIQLALLADPAFLGEMVQSLAMHIWVVGRVPLNAPRVSTSDEPVVRIAHVPVLQGGGTGVRSRGVEVQVPLAPDTVLILMERRHFSDRAGLDGTIVELSEQAIRLCNEHQAVTSRRQVYTVDGDFDAAQTVIEECPEAADPERGRWGTVP